MRVIFGGKATKSMAKIKRTTMKKDPNTVPLFELGLYGKGRKGLLRGVRYKLDEGKRPFIATPNPEFIIFSRRNEWFKRILLKANFLIPDGIGLVWATRLLLPKENQLRETVAGVDLTEDLCQLAAGQNLSVYFFGSTPPTGREQAGVAGRALARMKQKYLGLRGWAESGSALEINRSTGEWRNKKLVDESIKEIQAKKPDFLFVALGMGKQEKLIVDYWEKLPVKLAMGVGGAFDYLSLKVKRPPLWLRKRGLEWLYRLLKQPWRIKRQRALIEFIWLVLTSKIH